MPIDDIRTAVEAYQKLSDEEKAVFHREIARRIRRRIRRIKGKGKRKARGAAPTTVPIRQAMAKATTKASGKKRRKPISTNGSLGTGSEAGGNSLPQ